MAFEPMIGALTLAGLLLALPAHGSQYQRAGRYLGKAMYKEYRIDRYLRRFEDRWVPESIKSLHPVVTLGRLVIEQRIEYEWSF